MSEISSRSGVQPPERLAPPGIMQGSPETPRTLGENGTEGFKGALIGAPKTRK